MKIFVLLMVVGFAGCAVFQDAQDKAVDNLVVGATAYCANTTESARLAIREDFNAKFGGTAVINCPE